MEVPARKDLQKKKPKPATRKSERPKRARSEAVLIKPTVGVSYAAILKNLKSRGNPEELGATIGGNRETRSKDLLVEVRREGKREVVLCLPRRSWRDSIRARSRLYGRGRDPGHQSHRGGRGGSRGS